MTNLSVSTGFDVDYYLDEVGSDYYLNAAGEPPGIWMGTAAGGLGLRGPVGGETSEGKANAEVMRGLYHHDVLPDGTPMTSRRRARYDNVAAEARAQEAIRAKVAALGKFATPEGTRRIELTERAKVRHAVPFYDMTLSAEKSVSVLYASYQAAAHRARAEHRDGDAEQAEAKAAAIEQALIETAQEHVKMLEQRAAYVRTGHHSKHSGEWRNADGLVVVAFPQHDNREHEPNLHVQMVILNKAQRADGADDKWRALDGAPLWAERLGLAAVDSVIFAEKLEALGYRMVQQDSGNGTEVGGIGQDVMDAYSRRSAVVRKQTLQKIAEFEQVRGHTPDHRVMKRIRQQAALENRPPKSGKAKQNGAYPAEAERMAEEKRLAGWIGRAQDASVQALENVHESAERYAAEHEPSSLPSETERAKIIRIAIAEVQRNDATWTRAKLLFELRRALVQTFPAGTPAREVLEGLADEALAGSGAGGSWPELVQIAPVADVVDVSGLDCRKDGTSVYRRPGEARWCTVGHLNTEEWLLKLATMPVKPRVTADQARQALAGTDLDRQQREAVAGMLTSARLMDCLVAPAGSGKTHVMAAFAHAWVALTGGRVIGVTSSENAARVMAGEGMTETYNSAVFLGKIKNSDETRRHVPVYPGDVIVVDEATQASTADLRRIMDIARRNGAQVKAVGDTEQLGPVEAGYMFPLIAREHGHWRLSEVRRFARAWEARASLKLREGDLSALIEYKTHGHLWHGALDRMHDEAVGFWLRDFLQGGNALLLAATNDEAAHLSALARQRLIELGKVAGADEITLSDGNGAGTGDLVRAKLNTRIDVDGQTLSNRDVIQITGWAGHGQDRQAVAVRLNADGTKSSPFLVPARYLRESAELAYAGNAYVAQGRTVDRGHLVVTPAMDRASAYVGMTRGRESNNMYVATGAPEPGAMDRKRREAYIAAQIAWANRLIEAGKPEEAAKVNLIPPDVPLRERAPWEAVVAQVLAKDDPELTAIEQLRATQDLVTHPAHLVDLAEAFWHRDVVPQIEEEIRARIGDEAYQRYQADPERPAFLQLLREHEIGGRTVAESLDAITGRDFAGTKSVAAVLHGRLEKEPPPARGQTQTFAERVPGGAAQPLIEETYKAADARQAHVGRQLAERPEPWALKAWGAPSAEPGALREDWERRAGIVGVYRELAGIENPEQALGPAPGGSRAVVRESFHSAVVALELEDEAAQLGAMGRGDLEARVREYERAQASAPADVSPQVELAKSQAEYAGRQAEEAQTAGNGTVATGAKSLEDMARETLAELAVLAAVRAEWAEAHEGQAGAAKTAADELRARGNHEKAEPEQAPEPTADEAEATVSDPAEIQANADIGEIHATVEIISAEIQAEPEAEAEADADMAEYLDQPGIRPEIEASAWMQGTTPAEPEPEADIEPEMEI